MLPTVRTMLDAAASEAVVEPHDVAADGEVASVPRVRTPASFAQMRTVAQRTLAHR